MGTDTGNYPACEWVELYNSGTTDINLQGWTLVDDAQYSHPIDANTWVDFANLATPYVLPAGDYAIIAENTQGTLKLNNAPIGPMTTPLGQVENGSKSQTLVLWPSTLLDGPSTMLLETRCR